ncbi:CPBP family intramembrane metalloprotease [Haloterrigena sp. H1]|uniref:CPBP family intramembrane glutamic endopeptidase n=1 Tax=Haloterrigena sp. H1 TaxID=2552943 RepID=UPI00110F0B38|nr:type II CAAX endopeptidase family protein [Haloterrigena sp. H1]TMT81455.1 CPBP family intramembrane metalloprotease [Haloterrigena sp. H1]
MFTDTNWVQSRSSISLAVIVGLIVALFGSPIIGQLNLLDRFSTSPTGSLLLNSAIMWFLVVAVLAIVLFWEKRSVTSIGLEMLSRRQAGVGVAGGVGGLALGLLATGIVVAAFNLDQPETLSAINELPLLVKLVIVGTAVITEELLWRGYPIERLTEITGSLWIGAATSFVVFLAVHYPEWGLVGAIPQTVFTLALVGVYIRTRNVVACIITHTIINVVMVLVLPAVI